MTSTAGTQDEQIVIPEPAVLAQRLVELGVPHGWIGDLLRHAAGLTAARREHLQECAALLDGLAGGTTGLPQYPPGPAVGLDFVVLFAALLPRLRRLESLRRIDPLVTAATLADLGRHVTVYRERHGRLGFDEQQWFGLHVIAIKIARSRHPESAVDYRVADLFDLPPEFIGAFDLVLEVINVQALPSDLRQAATAGVASLVAPGGRLVVVQNVRADDEALPQRPPWGFTAAEIDLFAVGGLQVVSSAQHPMATHGPAATRSRWLVEFSRPT